jgi:hypothetical protein
MRSRVMIIGLACASLGLYPWEGGALVRNRIANPVAPARAQPRVDDWANPYGPGLRLETDHYLLYTTVLDPNLLTQVPDFMESAHTAYNAQLPDPIEPLTRSTIYLFPNRAQWEMFTRDLTGVHAAIFLKIQEGAYCFNGSCIAYDIGLERTLAALAHEGWHQFTSRHFAFRLPSWLDEGMAMMFEAFVRRDGQCQFEPTANAYRLEPLRDTVSRGDLLPLEHLLATSPGEVMATDRSEQVQTLYGQSYALVRFLREAEGGRYLAGFRRLLADGLKGRWPLDPDALIIATDRNVPKTVEWNRVVGRQVFRYYVADDLDGIQRQYLAFCAQLAAR